MDKEGEVKDFFCNRIIVPIKNTKGEVISLAGRMVPSGDKEKDDKFPKYMNLPESLLYKKSKVLFGLYEALNKKAFQSVEGVTPYAFLVEGYFDVISMQEAGVAGTVAGCGTAVTDFHLLEIKRYTENLVLYMDSKREKVDKNGVKKVDMSGVKAWMKLVDVCLANGIKTKVVQTQGYDPDEFARKYNLNFKA
jgi:DNA primase